MMLGLKIRRSEVAATYQTPFPYFGGKTIYLDVLLGKFPPHKCYVEPFGGSASVLLNKAPSDCEVYNDIDSDLVNFFRVLRDPEKCELLQDILYLTPFSREEYIGARESLRENTIKSQLSDVERARLWFLMLRQSFGATPGTGGWSINYRKSKTGTWRDAIARLETFSRRLLSVHIENQSFEHIFKLYDSPDTFFYCDPPYVLSSRTGGKCYRNELTDFQQTVFLRCVKACKGKVIVSGYHSDKYDRELDGWQVIEVKGKAFSQPTKDGKERDDRTEVLWVKPNSVKAQGLWEEMPMRLQEYTEAPTLI